MKVTSLLIFLLVLISPATAASQERVLTHETSSGLYSASIKSGRAESQGAMRVEGTYADIFDTKNWGINDQHIWRVYIATPMKFIWNDSSSDPGKVELIVYEMSLSQDKNLSALVVNVNNHGEDLCARRAHEENRSRHHFSESVGTIQRNHTK